MESYNVKFKKNLIIIINSLSSGGAEKQSVELASKISNYFTTKVIVIYDVNINYKYLNKLKESNVDLIILHGSVYSKIYYIYKILNNNNESIVISYLTTANIINAIIGSLANVKYKFGGIRNSRMGKFKLQINKFLHKYLLYGTIFNSISGYTYFLNKGFVKEKSFVIPNGICLHGDKYLENKKLFKFENQNKKNYHVLSVGRFVDQKDYKTAIKSIYLLKQKIQSNRDNYNIRYTIIGYGELENQIIEWCHYYNVADIISVIIDPPNIQEYFLTADVYLSTSIFEGVSNSILEAMSYKIPVIATEVGDNNKLIINDICGFIVPIKKSEIISSKLYYLLKNDEERIKMGERSYEYIRRNYSMSRMIINYKHLFNNLK